MVDLAQFPHTCTIERPAVTYNAVGQPINTFASLATGVACHWQPGGERELAGRYVVNVENPRIFFNDGQSITLADRVSAVSVATGRTFQVTRLSVYSGSHIEATLEQLR